MNYKISWRNRNFGPGRSMRPLIQGISTYTLEKAENQIAKWQTIFPQNTYYLESV